MLPSLRIVTLCVCAAICYGVAHDQITARVCLEYFTVGHPRLIDSDSPTVLGLFWGTVATWWVGLPLGLVLALAARAGTSPRLAATDLLRPLGVLLASMSLAAALMGLTGYALARSGVIRLGTEWAARIAVPQQDAFLADLWAHSASYAGGVLGGLVLSVHTLVRRRRLTT